MVPRLASFLIFLGVAITLIGGMHYYVWARLVRDPHLPQAWGRPLTAAIIALGLALPLTLIASRFFAGAAIRPAIWFGFAWMGIGFLLVAFLGIADAGRLLAFIARKLTGSEPDAARRVFLARGLAAGVGGVVAGLSAFGFRSALGPVEIKELTVKLRGLPQALSGFKLVQISDLHIGPLLRKDWLAHVVARIQSIAPDAVAITGDLVDGSVDELRDHIAPLADLKPSHGVWFVTGNHEYYSGADEWLAHLATLGIRVLRNERVDIRGVFDLAGVDDASASRMLPHHGQDVKKAAAGRDPSRALVLLAHQPKALRHAQAEGVDLQLSGHVHGGQLMPFNWLVRLDQPLVAGLYLVDKTWVYVSSGTGYWGPPMRVGTQAEITHIQLVSAAEGRA
jgi:predicted MPP superfamily phosphohydrolase